MPETAADIQRRMIEAEKFAQDQAAAAQKQKIEAAQFGLTRASAVQKMGMDAVQADMKVALQKAEIAKAWIEVEVDKLKLDRLRKAYREYDRQVIRLKQRITLMEREAKKFSRFVNQAGWFFDGESVPRQVRHLALSSVSWVLRKLFITATAVQEVLNRHMTALTIPAIGSVDYMIVLDALAEIKTAVDAEQERFSASIAASEASLKELQNSEWSKAGII